MANSTITILIIIVLFIALISIFWISYKLHKKDDVSYEEFCEKIKDNQNLYMRYNFDNPFIPTFEEAYRIIEIKNGWIKLVNLNDETDIVHLPLREAYDIFNLEPFNL
jgi:hypothetical protein